MFNLDKFISDSVTFRPTSMFEPDIKANAETLTREIKGKKVCVIGGAGSIGSILGLSEYDNGIYTSMCKWPILRWQYE